MTEKGGLSGQVAVVSGGSGAIGRAIIAALIDNGAHAISLDVSDPGDKIPWVQCDIRDDHAMAAALASVFQTHGKLDLIIHAAGVSKDAVVWKVTAEEWDFVQAVNLRGAFLLMRHGIPLMRRGSGGRIVLIGSINGSRGKFGASAYSASKAGLVGLTKSVAREVARFGILINVIEPGWVRTPLTDSVSQKVKDAALSESLTGTLLEPSDIANSVVFLCGSGGRQITGQILRVDGGQFLGSM